jgi:hypothetical protein
MLVIINRDFEQKETFLRKVSEKSIDNYLNLL